MYCTDGLRAQLEGLTPRFGAKGSESDFPHYCVKLRLNLLRISAAASAATQPNARHVIHAKWQINTLYISCHVVQFFLSPYFTHSSAIQSIQLPFSNFYSACQFDYILVFFIASHTQIFSFLFYIELTEIVSKHQTTCWPYSGKLNTSLKS